VRGEDAVDKLIVQNQIMIMRVLHQVIGPGGLMQALAEQIVESERWLESFESVEKIRSPGLPPDVPR
jgi:hypothetical protein